MQNVSFNSIEEFFEFVPGKELKIIKALRKIIYECMPDCIEKLSYNVPYYKRHFNICFLWPASVTWGGVKQNGVRLGFTSGNLLQDDIGYLNKGNRKQVSWKDFNDLKEIDTKLIRDYLHQAVLIDQIRAKQKLTRIKKI